MARKKKTVTVKDSQPIIYSGNVTVKKIKNGKIVSTQTMHNAGYNPLFQFLCLQMLFIVAQVQVAVHL